MMTIKTEFPFDSCQSCDQCVLDVTERNAYSFGEIVERKIIIGCRNTNLCLKQYKKFFNEKENKNNE